MAHLKQKQISDNSCKAIIIDTLMESVNPLTEAELSSEITSLFHVLVSSKRLTYIINELISKGILMTDDQMHLRISDLAKIEYTSTMLQARELQEQAILSWIEYIRTFKMIDKDVEEQLKKALPVFLRNLFVRHGVSSYQLLTSTDNDMLIDSKQIAKHVANQFDERYITSIEELLPTIFQAISDSNVLKYLKQSIEKAVGYISEVISEDNLSQVTSSLNNLTIYLDTNVLYRLLKLQGKSRYESIKETLEFCKKYNIKLKISAQTKKELASRLEFDATVLRKFPVKTDLVQAGYKYRTSDNYVSTYWESAASSRISVDDFISYYANFDLLLAADSVEIEEIDVDENNLIEKAKDYFERLALRDPYHEKKDGALWHDAYNIAYIQKMQKVSAHNAIDTQCLFLTTDQALLSFQSEDHELVQCAPIVIAPSQLLQMFSFTKADNGFEETFVKFFASSSLGISFEYDNDDIQEVLSRLSHYQGVNPQIAEKILARELINSRYINEASDVLKEEIIYNEVSEEINNELIATKKQLSETISEKETLNKEYQDAIILLKDNQKRYEKEKAAIEEQSNRENLLYNNERTARLSAEEEVKKHQGYIQVIESHYTDEKWKKWRKKKLLQFWIGGVLGSIIIVIATLYYWQRYRDNSAWGLLSGLCIPVFMLSISVNVFSPGVEAKTKHDFLNEYRDKLNIK